MARVQTRFTRGETFVAGLKVRSGDVSSGTFRMVMKKAINAGQVPGDDAPDIATLTVAYVANIDPDDLTSPAAIVGTLPADVSEGLVAGRYVMDARITVGGRVEQTDVVDVIVDERVTEAN